ncbi:MAG: DUF2085 domain-containing protein [Anaerolineales bacterium]
MSTRIVRHWLLILNVVMGLYAGLPWLAPVLMKIGWAGPANVIYLIYSTQCHQLPQRSFFLFGEKLMYSLAEIQAAWQATTDPLVLRQFVGDAEMGWKVAWSDRMVSMYTGVFVAGLVYALLRRWMKTLPLWVAVLLMLPLVMDGGTHLVSDFAGIGNGFRDTNVWLASLTFNALPPAFYSGDALGSFNSWMRLITGVLFAAGLVLWSFPHLDEAFIGAGHPLAAGAGSFGLRVEGATVQAEV